MTEQRSNGHSVSRSSVHIVWSTKNSKAIEPMWEAAIYLSEKHNWTEIHEVLVQQYEFYNHYKDKV